MKKIMDQSRLKINQRQPGSTVQSTTTFCRLILVMLIRATSNQGLHLPLLESVFLITISQIPFCTSPQFTEITLLAMTQMPPVLTQEKTTLTLKALCMATKLRTKCAQALSVLKIILSITQLRSNGGTSASMTMERIHRTMLVAYVDLGKRDLVIKNHEVSLQELKLKTWWQIMFML